MAVTLEDVGQKCGVSRSTVSRVMNNSPLVNEETKKRVMSTIREMSYAPNFLARSLTRNRTETIAVTLPDITGGVFPEILAGMDEVACERAYHLLVVFVGGARPNSPTMRKLMTHRRVDAIVTVASAVEEAQLADLAQLQMPLVSVACRSPILSVPSVLFDDVGGAIQATRHLLSLGRRRLLHLRGPQDNYDAEERSRGFRLALREAGIAFNPAMELDGGFKREQGMAALTDALSRGVSFDGVFAGNDEMAIGVLDVLTRHGHSVPGDVAVVGFDDIESARYLGLSSVRIPTREMGRAAVRVAFDLIDGKGPIATQVLPTNIIVRASSRA